MKQKYKFPPFACRDCPDYQCVGSSLNETRYCGGFPKKKKPRRFRSSDPKCKAPKWCPKILEPAVCRVYKLKDDFSWANSLNLLPKKAKTPPYAYPSEWRYTLCYEGTDYSNAKAFYQAACEEPTEQLLDGKLNYGDVVEIDDGLKPYCFYYRSYQNFVLVGLPFHPKDDASGSEP